ncbi:MAG: hypothetical protein IRZ29_08715 [Thermoflavifilum sp.]|nr:hypothetical protein [Thermoflavifilum sp.]
MKFAELFASVDNNKHLVCLCSFISVDQKKGFTIGYGIGADAPLLIPEEEMKKKVEEDFPLVEGIDFEIKEIFCFEVSLGCEDATISIDLFDYMDDPVIRKIYSLLIAEGIGWNLKLDFE